jgi:Ca2+-binding EF-hand superfamily protein
MAPELLEGDYGPKVDVWSLGVIAFMLLSSSMPFFGKDRAHVIKKILSGRFHFSSRRWRYVSEEAKQFVKTLLRRNPVKRPTAEMVCEELWLHHVFTTRDSVVDTDQMDNIQATIQSFSQYQTLKKLALMVVAYKSTSEEIGFLRKMFNKFDRQNDGEISLEEFKEALHENYDYTEEEAEAMFRGLDVDGTGSVHYIEFLAATIEAHGTIDEERLAEAFDRIDSDDSGTITVEDLKDFLGEDIPESYLEKVIDEAGVSTDHKITYEEFLALWDFDTDEVLREAKQNVGSRRVSRQASYVSTSSVSSDTDSADRTLSLSSSSEAESGSLFYRRQRALSIHGIKDDSHGHPQIAPASKEEEAEQERVEVSKRPADESREQMELLEKMEEILYNKGLLPEQQQSIQSA